MKPNFIQKHSYIQRMQTFHLSLKPVSGCQNYLEMCHRQHSLLSASFVRWYEILGVLTTCFIKKGLTCTTVMEKPFYIACEDILCFQCGVEHLAKEGEDDMYPLCTTCTAQGIKPAKKSSRKVKPKQA